MAPISRSSHSISPEAGTFHSSQPRGSQYTQSGVSPPVEPIALDIRGVLARYSIGRSTLYVEMREGRLRPTKVGKRTLFDPRDLATWWNAHRNASGGAQ